MSINRPLVSIIIPTYNRKDHLFSAVQSILNQDYKNWECVIVDDGSNIFYGKEIVNHFNDSRISFFIRPTDIAKGPSPCRNYGFLKSSGDYIQWMDDDDFIKVDKLSLQVKALEDSGFEISLSSWDYYWEGKSLEVQRINNGESFDNIEDIYTYLAKEETFFPPHVFLMKRSLVAKGGLWDEKLTLNDDAEFFNRQFLEAHKVLNVPEAMAFYRNHDQSRVSSFDNDKIGSLIESYHLMHGQLLDREIEARSYFKWKLLKLLRSYGHDEKIRPLILRRQKMFLFYGLNPKYLRFYKLKHWVYKNFYGKIKKKIRDI